MYMSIFVSYINTSYTHHTRPSDLFKRTPWYLEHCLRFWYTQHTQPSEPHYKRQWNKQFPFSNLKLIYTLFYLISSVEEPSCNICIYPYLYLISTLHIRTIHGPQTSLEEPLDNYSIVFVFHIRNIRNPLSLAKKRLENKCIPFSNL